MALLALAFIAIITAAAVACPTCKDGIAENDPEHQALARGFYYSILFMMSMPFLIVGTFGSFAYLSIRRARQQQSGEAATDPSYAPEREYEAAANL
ncbi:MAG: hypothetical protein WEH44_02530 [Pirellulaceae bacterium]